MKNTKSIIIVLAVVFSMVSVASAQTQGDYQQSAKVQKERIYKELNLTPEQQKKLEANRKVQGEELAKLLSVIKEKRTQLQEALKSSAVTRIAVEPLVKEIKSLQAQLIDYRINGIFFVKEVLTAEQFAKFQELTEKRQENRKKRLGNWQEKRKGFAQKQE